MSDLKIGSIGDLTGRVALVTGGGTGIGEIIARGFAANGAKVYITGRRIEVLEKVAASTQGVYPLQLDITDKAAISEAVKKVADADGKLDILVNNAGVMGPVSPFISDHSLPEHEKLGESLFNAESVEGWMDAFKTNTFAPYFMTTGFLSLLQKGAEARGPRATSAVINISSTTADLNLSMNGFAYTSSKAAVERVSRALSTELARSEIPVRVNVLAPGGFPSQMIPVPLEIIDQFMGQPFPGALNPVPPKRIGRDHEMVMATIFLATNGYTNGAVVRVDGGHNLVNP